MLTLRHAPTPLAAALVLACASVAAADQTKGAFVDLQAEGEHWLLVLADGQRFAMPHRVYETHQRLLRSLQQEGGEVVVTHGADRVVSDLALVGARESSGVRRIMMSGQFKRYLQDRKELELVDGSRYRVSAETLADRDTRTAFLRVVLFLDEGEQITFLLVGDEVVEVKRATRSGDRQESAQVRALLERTQPGDVIEIRLQHDAKFRTYSVRQVGLSDLTLSPEVPGRPGDFQGKIRLERSKIEELKNPAAEQRRGTAPPGQEGGGQADTGLDAFARQRVRVGDMIGIGFETGQLIDLTATQYSLRVWRNGVWGEAPLTGARADVTEVRVHDVWLQSTQTIPLQIEGTNGALEVRVRRSCERKLGGLRFRVELIHDLPQLILIDLKVRFHLGPMGLAPGAQAKQVAERLIPLPLFNEQPVQIEHEVSDEQLLDGWVEVVVFPRNKLLITDSAARGHLIKALLNTVRPDALAALYRIAGENGDPTILRYMITRALLEQDAHRRHLLVEGLAQARDQVAGILLEDLAALDRQLKIVIQGPQGLVEAPLPSEARPIDLKLDMIELLGQDALGPALQGQAGARLFDLFLDRDDFSEAIVKTFTRRPVEAVATLLGLATNLPVKATTEQRQRAEQAAVLLAQLGRPIFAPLLLEMRRQEIDTAAFEDAIAAGKVPPSELVKQGLGVLISASFRRRRARLDRQTQVAVSHHANKELEKALSGVRAVLDEEPTHGGAQELLPQVLVDLAAVRASAGERGEAALLYEEALPLLKGGQKVKAAAPLAELIVQGCSEAVDALAIRSQPHVAGVLIRPAKVNEPLTNASETTRGWLQFELAEGGTGYLRKVSAATVIDVWKAKEGPTAFTIVEEELKRAKGLSAEVEARANEVFGRLSAREAERLYIAHDYPKALHHFDQAAKYAPSDPRLELRMRCWLKANTGPLAAVGLVLLVAVGFAGLQMFSRPKRVKFEGEFRHYGADRTARERDLDVEE